MAHFFKKKLKSSKVVLSNFSRNFEVSMHRDSETSSQQLSSREENGPIRSELIFITIRCICAYNKPRLMMKHMTYI